MTTSGAPTPPRFKRSSPRKKSQLRSRRLAAGEAEAAGAPALARAPLPSPLEVDAVPRIGRALPREFFEVDALDLAPRLLGKLLRRDEVILRITEVTVLQNLCAALLQTCKSANATFPYLLASLFVWQNGEMLFLCGTKSLKNRVMYDILTKFPATKMIDSGGGLQAK